MGLDRYRDVTDSKKNRRTDRITVANTYALSAPSYLSRVKKN